MSNRQRISFDRVIEIWHSVVRENICPRCSTILTVEPHDKTGEGTLADLDYVLYICDGCNGEYYASGRLIGIMGEVYTETCNELNIFPSGILEPFNAEDNK